MLETALLSFALTMVAAPPLAPPAKPAKKTTAKAAAAPKEKPPPKTAVVQQDPRFGNFARGVLKCYHPTARYQSAAIEQRPLPGKPKEGEKGSALISIDYVGVSNASYNMTVAVLAKPDTIKTVIQSDNAKVHAYENCELAEWIPVK